METIKEAAGKCGGCRLSCLTECETFESNDEKTACCNRLERHGFIQGVAWAERWIPVEEELPDNQDIVLVKTDKGCVSTAYLHGKKSGFICYGQEAYNDFGEVTHWRPIEHK